MEARSISQTANDQIRIAKANLDFLARSDDFCGWDIQTCVKEYEKKKWEIKNHNAWFHLLEQDGHDVSAFLKDTTVYDAECAAKVAHLQQIYAVSRVTAQNDLNQAIVWLCMAWSSSQPVAIPKSSGVVSCTLTYFGQIYNALFSTSK
jgi:hypothetical protein